MLGSVGDLARLMKQAGQMKANMARMQSQLAAMTYEAEAGGGLVKAVLNGRLELVDLKIDPAATADVERLEDMIKGAVSAAGAKAQEGVKSELQKLTGGLNVPGLTDMLSGGA